MVRAANSFSDDVSALWMKRYLDSMASLDSSDWTCSTRTSSSWGSSISKSTRTKRAQVPGVTFFRDNHETNEKRTDLSEFRSNNLVLVRGSAIASGGACTVFNVKSMGHGQEPVTVEKKKKVPVFSKYREEHESGFVVVKCLSAETKQDSILAQIETSNLINEANIMRRTSHEHIVKFFGLTRENHVEGSEFSLILERLETALDVKVEQWRRHSRERPLRFGTEGKRKRFMSKRLAVMLDAARSIHYLHQNGIVHGDIKAENFGFDKNGVLKLFDFGKASFLNGLTRKQPSNLHRSGRNTSWRFIAPEVALHQSYSKESDVYSFGLLLWHVLALAVPFQDIASMEEHRDMVIGRKYRPPIDERWPCGTSELINRCLDHDPTNRPTMDDCVRSLDCAGLDVREQQKCSFSTVE